MQTRKFSMGENGGGGSLHLYSISQHTSLLNFRKITSKSMNYWSEFFFPTIFDTFMNTIQ